MKSKKNLAAIILAAGQGTRMKSALPKVLQPLLGKPLIDYPVTMTLSLGVNPLVIVVGKNKKYVEEGLLSSIGANKKINFAIQDPPLGTAHAVQMGLKKLVQFKGDVLIANGDLPLMRAQTVQALLNQHRQKKATVSFVTAKLDDAGDYGRVLRDGQGNVLGVVEAKDATDEQKTIGEINVGVYVVDSTFLREKLKAVSSKNSQSEFYLPDLIAMALTENLTVETLVLSDIEEGLGANTQEELAQASQILSQRNLKKLMAAGVRVIHPETVFVENDVVVASDTVLYGPCYLFGKTRIGSFCTIEAGSWIRDCTLGDSVHVRASCYLDSSSIENDVAIGPMAHLRPQTVLKSGSKIGNFVEIKKSVVGKGSKVNHLTYIGDALIGQGVNIGAGVITCNYDGVNKHQTIIEDGVFVGSDSQLVAPVKVGKGAYIGSGSTITKNVVAGSLAVARVNQVEIKGWAKKRKKH